MPSNQCFEQSKQPPNPLYNILTLRIKLLSSFQNYSTHLSPIHDHHDSSNSKKTFSSGWGWWLPLVQVFKSAKSSSSWDLGNALTKLVKIHSWWSATCLSYCNLRGQTQTPMISENFAEALMDGISREHSLPSSVSPPLRGSSWPPSGQWPFG